MRGRNGLRCANDFGPRTSSNTHRIDSPKQHVAARETELKYGNGRWIGSQQTRSKLDRDEDYSTFETSPRDVEAQLASSGALPLSTVRRPLKDPVRKRQARRSGVDWDAVESSARNRQAEPEPEPESVRAHDRAISSGCDWRKQRRSK